MMFVSCIILQVTYIWKHFESVPTKINIIANFVIFDGSVFVGYIVHVLTWPFSNNKFRTIEIKI